MKKALFLIPVMAVLLLTSFTFSPGSSRSGLHSFPPGKWTVDKNSSSVKFSVTRLLIETVEGKFNIFGGTMDAAKPDFSDALIIFIVDVSSIDTDDEAKDKHLKGEDFFNVEKFPQMKFVSTSFKPAGGNNYKLNGKLTIRDQTLPVTFDVTYGGTTTVAGKQKASFKAKTTINRFDYGLKWSKLTESGGLVVSKEVDIVLDVVLNKN